ncbi:histone acetyltransferase type B catalytic subunit-like [Photinus pyralis]|uniref:histone acetyltransferase type B catalytic subunit-like n=1 Tax=Photinus pyralis TaxID=7054 RepID=UPI001266FE4C|nr:histone acetyltransferase type B catalytic subunit-like [Photinus pyralis]
MSTEKSTSCIAESKRSFFLVRNLLSESELTVPTTSEPEVDTNIVTYNYDKFTATAIDIGLIDPPRDWYRSHCRNVITIIIMYNRHAFIPGRRKRSFKPEFVQQVFGSGGEIYGYHNLSVDIYYLANSAVCYVELTYTGMTTPPFELEPDDIMERLAPWLPRGFKTRRFPFFIEYCKERRTHKMFGTPMERVQIYNPTDRATYNYTFTCCRNVDTEFKEFHDRFQSMTVWFFKKARLIEVDDPNWLYIYVASHHIRIQGVIIRYVKNNG